MSKIYTPMTNVLSAEFPNNSLSAGAWLWSSSILFCNYDDIDNDNNGCKDGNSNDLKLSQYKVEISHNLDVFDPVKNMEQS